MLTQQLISWQPLYLSFSAASATLAGLLFVALSMHLRALQEAGAANVRHLAQHTFQDFVRCLVISLFLLMPKPDPFSLGVVLLVVGAYGALQIGWTLIRTARGGAATLHRRYVMKRLFLSVIADGFFVVAGLPLMLGVNAGDTGMEIFGGLMMLLISSTRNSWFILVHELG